VAQASPSQQEARGSAPVFVPEMRRINISDGTIFDRQRVESEDTCQAESYEPI